MITKKTFLKTEPSPRQIAWFNEYSRDKEFQLKSFLLLVILGSVLLYQQHLISSLVLLGLLIINKLTNDYWMKQDIQIQIAEKEAWQKKHKKLQKEYRILHSKLRDLEKEEQKEVIPLEVMKTKIKGHEKNNLDQILETPLNELSSEQLLDYHDILQQLRKQDLIDKSSFDETTKSLKKYFNKKSK